MLVILKIVFLFLAVMYGYSNTFRAIKGQAVSTIQILLMTIGIVGFIVIKFKLYL